MADGFTSGGGETARSAPTDDTDSGTEQSEQEAREQLTETDPGSSNGASGQRQDVGGGLTSGGGETTTQPTRDQKPTDEAREQLQRTDPGAGSRGQTAEEVARDVAQEQTSELPEEGIETGGVARTHGGDIQDRAATLEQRYIERSEFADDPNDVAVRREGDRLVAQYSRSAATDILESRYRQSLRSAAAASLHGDQRPTGQGISPGGPLGPTRAVDLDDVLFTRNNGEVTAKLDTDAQKEVVRERAAQRFDEFSENDIVVEQTGGEITARPSEQAIRENLAGRRNDISPEDVEIVRENGEIVGGRVTTTQETREGKVLPSVDVDVSERSVSYESGDLSAIPDPTPARLFGTVAGMEEREIQELERRAERVSEDTQGAPPVGLGSGRAAPVRAILAAGGIAATGAAASQQTETGGGASGAERVETIRVGEVGLGEGVVQSEIEVGEVAPGSELSVSEAPQTQTEVEVGGDAVSATEVGLGEGVVGTEVDVPTGEGEASSGGQQTQTGRDSSVVPGEYPLPGRDIPRNRREDRAEKVDPGDIIDTGARAAPLQQRQRQREEVVIDVPSVEEELLRRRRAQEREVTLGEDAVEIPIEGVDNEFLYPREFPTGAGAVIGFGSEMLAEAQAQQAQVQESDATVESPAEAQAPEQITPAAADQRQAGVQAQGLETEQVTEAATELELLTAPGFVSQQAVDTVQATETQFETQQETIEETVFETMQATETSTVRPFIPDYPRGARQRGRDEGTGAAAPVLTDFLNPISGDVLVTDDDTDRSSPGFGF